MEVKKPVGRPKLPQNKTIEELKLGLRCEIIAATMLGRLAEMGLIEIRNAKNATEIVSDEIQSLLKRGL